MSDAVLTDTESSPLLRTLRRHLDRIVSRLDDPAWWSGLDVGDGLYQRLENVDYLVSSGPDPHKFSVGVHVFDQPGDGQMHDHRWPFAVFPFGENSAEGDPLYDMPWKYRWKSGTVIVRSRHPYAIERTEVRHAVHPLRPHMSIVLTDITEPAARPNRLSVNPLTLETVENVLTRTRRALGWQISEAPDGLR